MVTRRADGSYSRAWRRASIILLWPPVRFLMKHDWQGQQNIPADGGVILACNHLSYADVLAVSLFCHEAGRYPVFLAKASLFKIKILGPIIAKLGQLPVSRGQVDAALVLKDAEQGVRDGACVIVYPEGTVTRDPDQWPMVAKTGVARLALATGAPVIPVAHWGAQRILPYGSTRPHLFPRSTVRIIAGPPVDLSAFGDQPLTAPALRDATAAIMSDITGLLTRLRDGTPPKVPYHPAVARRAERQALRALAEEQQGGTQPTAESTTEASSP